MVNQKQTNILFLLTCLFLFCLLLNFGFKPKHNLGNLSRGRQECFRVERKRIRGSSLFPLIRNDEQVWALFGYYNCHPLTRGDIVIVHFKTQPKKLYVKRLLGLPGDKVVVKNKHLWVNGKLITNSEGKPYLIDETGKRKLEAPLFNQRIAPGYYLVLSNQIGPFAYDSRFFGYIEKHHIVGKIKYQK